MNQQTAWPLKTREIESDFMNSTAWNGFEFRDDDIIIGSYAKAGTTWIQQIVGQLVFDGAERVPINDISPWLDEAIKPRDTMQKVKAQKHRRLLKTHLPLDALTFSRQAKYIYVARDGRDIVWSFYNLQAKVSEIWTAMRNAGEIDPSGPDLADTSLGAPDPDIRRYFRRWLHEDGYPIWPFWENVRTWWDAREVPNILLVHFADLKADLEGEVGRIARFLGYAISEKRWPLILDHCSFDHMKKNALDLTPLGGAMYGGNAEVFINKGVNGRWRDILTRRDIAEYEERARDALGHECAHWLAAGSRPFRENPAGV